MSEINMGFGILGCTYDKLMSQQSNPLKFYPAFTRPSIHN